MWLALLASLGAVLKSSPAWLTADWKPGFRKTEGGGEALRGVVFATPKDDNRAEQDLSHKRKH